MSELILFGAWKNCLISGSSLLLYEFTRRMIKLIVVSIWGFYFLSLAPLLGSLLPFWNIGLITQFLVLSQVVGLPGWVISSSQGLYLNTGQHKHRKMQTHIKHT
jgi:hypothetical protein